MKYLFLFLPLLANAESPVKILECGFEFMPMQSIQVYKFDHKLRIFETKPDSPVTSRILPEEQWNKKQIDLLVDADTTGLLYKEGRGWNFIFKTRGGATISSGADCNENP